MVQRSNPLGICTMEHLSRFSLSYADTVDSMVKQIANHIISAAMGGRILVTAVTNRDQARGAQALEKCGFVKCMVGKGYPRAVHGESSITLWCREITMADRTDQPKPAPVVAPVVPPAPAPKSLLWPVAETVPPSAWTGIPKPVAKAFPDVQPWKLKANQRPRDNKGRFI